jgi:hypothetical protein
LVPVPGREVLKRTWPEAVRVPTGAGGRRRRRGWEEGVPVLHLPAMLICWHRYRKI